MTQLSAFSVFLCLVIILQVVVGFAVRRQDCGIACPKDHCCAMLWLPGRKRLFVNGFCQEMKRQGQRCVPGGTRHDCECREGLECVVADGQVEGICT